MTYLITIVMACAAYAIVMHGVKTAHRRIDFTLNQLADLRESLKPSIPKEDN